MNYGLLTRTILMILLGLIIRKDKYNTVCTSFTGTNLDHCIAGYYDAVAGYQDARVAIHTVKRGNDTNVSGINMTNTNTSNANATSSKGS